MTLKTRRPRGQSRDTGDAEPKEGEPKPAKRKASTGPGGSGFYQQRALTHHRCPCCGGHGKLTVERRAPGSPYAFFINCFNVQCKSLGPKYLAALARAVGAPSGGAVMDDPYRWLGRPDEGRRARPSQPAPLPSSALIHGWQEQLFAKEEALAYLLTVRGLTVTTIRKRRIGYDGEAFTIPIYNRTRELVNLRRRAWPGPFRRADGATYRYAGLRGRNRRNDGVQLYPTLPPRGLVMLCEGEFDALLLREHGLQGVTSTAGTTWLGRWTPRVKGRKVAVVYDAGEAAETIATNRATGLREAGVDAWPVRLSRGGLRPKEDVTDWFVKYGRSADALKALIRAERTRYRRRRGPRR